MDSFNILENKVAQLVARIKELKEEIVKLNSVNAQLKQENSGLLKKIEALETSVLKNSASVEEEKALAKMVVEDLIKSIDVLVGSETQS